MRINFNKIQSHGYQTGFCPNPLILYWLKTLLAYTVDFNLDIQVGKLQEITLPLSPFFQSPSFGTPPAGSSPYARSTKAFYGLSIAIYSLLFIWLYSNVFYYREFSILSRLIMKVVSKVLLVLQN